MALQDFAGIERHATALTELSNEADWFVQESVVYFTLSDNFRRSTEAMALHARDSNIEAIADDYVRMTESCLDCHTHMREERRLKDLPGRES